MLAIPLRAVSSRERGGGPSSTYGQTQTLKFKDAKYLPSAKNQCKEKAWEDTHFFLSAAKDNPFF